MDAGEVKPLHVQVAEALGQNVKPWGEGQWRTYGEDGWPIDDVPRYDTNWAATGPLIERLRIDVCAYSDESGGWLAEAYRDGRIREIDGPSPLIAVCNLILALKASGKL